MGISQGPRNTEGASTVAGRAFEGSSASASIRCPSAIAESFGLGPSDAGRGVGGLPVVVDVFAVVVDARGTVVFWLEEQLTIVPAATARARPARATVPSCIGLRR